MRRHLLYLLYASACEQFYVCVQFRETKQSVQACRSETQITPDMCGVCVRRACLCMTLECSNLDLWCSVFFAVLYICERVFGGEKDPFRYPAARTYI